MKKDMIYLGVFLIMVVVFSFPLARASLPLSGKVIAIDPGHGGVDPGSVVGEVEEKAINLNISKALKKELERLGAKVYLTREADYDLASPNAYLRKKSDFDHRISLIHQSHADYYVSIHMNYLSDSSYYGPQVFYSNVFDENKEIAKIIQETLNEKLHTNRETKKISNVIYMYSKLKVPGVLIECGFLSNANEREKLIQENYVNELAKVIAESFTKI